MKTNLVPSLPWRNLTFGIAVKNHAKVDIKLFLSCPFLVLYILSGIAVTWSKILNVDFTLKYCLSAAVKLITNADPDKHSYCGYSIRFNWRPLILILDSDWVKKVLIFGIPNNTSAHDDNRKKYIVILDEGLRQRFKTTITTEDEHSVLSKEKLKKKH